MPAQSVVDTSSKSAPSCWATWAKNGVYAFLVSSGLGSSGPTPKRSLRLSSPRLQPTWARPDAEAKANAPAAAAPALRKALRLLVMVTPGRGRYRNVSGDGVAI